jgi:5-methyltetrahydropteroyltriglutamate--homocysteine methyltransferase
MPASSSWPGATAAHRARRSLRVHRVAHPPGATIDTRTNDKSEAADSPKGKSVILGLVTSKRPALESKDELKRRVDEAARFVPIEQICLSPQCGFASTVEGNAVTEKDQWAKLRLVVETAREIWGDEA